MRMFPMSTTHTQCHNEALSFKGNFSMEKDFSTIHILISLLRISILTLFTSKLY